MSKLLFLTSTCEERVGAMMATITGVMRTLGELHRKAAFVLAYTDGYYPKRELTQLSLLANFYGHSVNWVSARGMSVAHTKHHPFLIDLYWTHFVNLDDDLIVNPKAITWMVHLYAPSRVYENDIITFGCFDVANVRGYADWDDVIYPSYQEFLQHHPSHKAKVHRIEREDIIDPYDSLSQLYMMPRVVWEDKNVWGPVLVQFTQVGKRGYDIFLEQQLLANGYTIVFQAGAESLHFGLEEGYLGTKWKSADVVIEGNVAFDKDSSVQGGESLPTTYITKG